jgi:hypothetical protein
MASTHSGASTLRRAITEDSAKEFLTVSGEEGSFDIPSSRRRGAGALLIAITTATMAEGHP